MTVAILRLFPLASSISQNEVVPPSTVVFCFLSVLVVRKRQQDGDSRAILCVERASAGQVWVPKAVYTVVVSCACTE